MQSLSRASIGFVLALSIPLALSARDASADDILWTNASGGSFQDPGNWSAGVPTDSDIAIFDLDDTYEVSFADDATVQGANVKQGDITWELGEYSIIGSTNSEFHIGRDTGDESQLTIAGGMLSGLRIEVGRYGGAGALHLTDSSSLHGGLSLSVGRGGQGGLRIDNGASANVFGFLIGEVNGIGELGIGNAVLSGVGTSATASNLFLFHGTLNIEAGARLQLLGFSGGGGQGNPTLKVAGVGSELSGTSMGFGSDGPMTAVIEDGATFNSAGTGVSQSTLTIDDATWLEAQGAKVRNNGTITITGNSLAELAGLLEIQPQGTVNLNGGTLRVGSFDNQGTFNWNSGTFEITGGLGLVVGGGGGPDVWEVESGQTLGVTQTLQVAEGGTLQVAAGGAVTATEIALEGGTLSGNGQTAGLLTNDGRIEPGFSPGLLSHDGDFAQLADGLLHIELAGLGDFDTLAITGDAELDGKLDVTLLGGYQPQLGDSFKFLTAGSLTGAFSELDLPALPGDWRWSLDYAADGVTLAVAAVPEPVSVVYALGALAAVATLARRRRA